MSWKATPRARQHRAEPAVVTQPEVFRRARAVLHEREVGRADQHEVVAPPRQLRPARHRRDRYPSIAYHSVVSGVVSTKTQRFARAVAASSSAMCRSADPQQVVVARCVRPAPPTACARTRRRAARRSARRARPTSVLLPLLSPPTIATRAMPRRSCAPDRRPRTPAAHDGRQRPPPIPSARDAARGASRRQPVALATDQAPPAHPADHDEHEEEA